jgi:integrase/recombinase XerD
MMTLQLTKLPTVHVFVRHSSDCPHRDEPEAESFKRCRCRKHLRYRQNGQLHRIATGATTWADAERAKAELLAKLELAAFGKPVEVADQKSVREIADVFLAEVEQRGLGPDVPKKFRRLLDRLCSFCQRRNMGGLDAITLEHVLAFRAELWEFAKSGETRRNEQRRLRSFFRWCYAHDYIERIPSFFTDGNRMKIKDEREPTQPFEPEEMKNILAAVGKCDFSEKRAAQVHALILLMRWSMLSIIDATTLAKSELQRTGKKYRIVRRRIKTGVPVNVLIPKSVAEELLALPAESDQYFFWSGEGSAKSVAGHFTDYMKLAFDKAGIKNGHPHRLRDTGAVELLKQNVDIRVVSKALGHKSITTTERYYAPWNKAQQDLMDEKVEAAQQRMLKAAASA